MEKLTAYVGVSAGAFEAFYYSQDNGYAGTRRFRGLDEAEALRKLAKDSGYRLRELKIVRLGS